MSCSANDRRIGEACRTSSTLEGVERRALSRLNILRREASDRAALTRLQTRPVQVCWGPRRARGLSSLPVAGVFGGGIPNAERRRISPRRWLNCGSLRNQRRTSCRFLDALAVQLATTRSCRASAADAQAFHTFRRVRVDLTTVLGGRGRAVLSVVPRSAPMRKQRRKRVAAGVNVFKIGANDTDGKGAGGRADPVGAVGRWLVGRDAAGGVLVPSNTFHIDGGLPSMINMNAVLAAFGEERSIRGWTRHVVETVAVHVGKPKDAREMPGQLAKMAGVTGSVLYERTTTRVVWPTRSRFCDGLNKLPNAEELVSGPHLKDFGTDAPRSGGAWSPERRGPHGLATK